MAVGTYSIVKLGGNPADSYGNPPAGHLYLYWDADGEPHFVDENGLDREVQFDETGTGVDGGGGGGGSGDFSGPASATADNFVTFADATGKLGKDSGVNSASFDSAGSAAAAVAAHEAAGNPHPQYLTEAEGDAFYQPLDGDLSAIAALSGTNTIYYRSAANTWSEVTIGAGLDFTAGALSATGGGGGVSDGDYGDLTVSASGTVWTINNGVVTNAKLADASEGTLKGRIAAGAGAPSDLTLTEVLDNMAGDGTLNRGEILFRGSSAWQVLDAGIAGYQLVTQGSGLDPVWEQQTPYINQGVLVLTNTNPLDVDTDVSSSNTAYLVPGHEGNLIFLYTGSRHKAYTIASQSLSLALLSANTNYDVFAYDNSGTLTLEALAWTNATTRATGLTKTNGYSHKSGDQTRRWVGTIRIRTAGTSDDTKARRFCFSADNRRYKPLLSQLSGASWTYTTNTFRPSVNDTTTGVSRIEVVIGLQEEAIHLHCHANAYNSTEPWFHCGIGVDSTTVSSHKLGGGFRLPVYAEYMGNPGIGHHYFQQLEKSAPAGTTTWYGVAAGTGSDGTQSGMIGGIWA